MPALSRSVNRTEAMASRREREQWKRLKKQHRRALMLGRLPKRLNRVRIFGPSGMNKTTLLHYCEQQISRSEDGKLPVRVSDLSSFD
jgi:ABC-type phosphate/phosphonate transport system ATPase subunit